jgi:hypothetical protein
MTLEENRRRVDDEGDWFDANRDAIIKGHHNEWVVIRDHQVWGYFPAMKAGEAFMKAKGIEIGDFITHPCKTMEEELAQNFSVLPLPGGRHVTAKASV